MPEFFKHLHGLVGTNMLYALELVSCLSGRQCNSLVSRLSGYRLFSRHLEKKLLIRYKIERPASSPAEVVEQNDEESVLSAEKYSKVGLYLEKIQSRVYGRKKQPVLRV